MMMSLCYDDSWLFGPMGGSSMPQRHLQACVGVLLELIHPENSAPESTMGYWDGLDRKPSRSWILEMTASAACWGKI